MTPPIGTRPAGLGLALLLASGIASGCGDSLSSLEVVNTKIFVMTLNPNWGCKGKTVTAEAQLDEKLTKVLTDSEVFPTEMSFGDDTVFRSFNPSPSGTYLLEVFISPSAREGDRHPSLLLSCEDRSYEHHGTFTVRPEGPACGN